MAGQQGKSPSGFPAMPSTVSWHMHELLEGGMSVDEVMSRFREVAEVIDGNLKRIDDENALRARARAAVERARRG